MLIMSTPGHPRRVGHTMVEISTIPRAWGNPQTRQNLSET